MVKLVLRCEIGRAPIDRSSAVAITTHITGPWLVMSNAENAPTTAPVHVMVRWRFIMSQIQRGNPRCPFCKARSTYPGSMFAESYTCGTRRKFGEDAYHTTCFREGLIKATDESNELKAAIGRGGCDLSPCMSCGQTVVCVPDGMPMCHTCATATV